ncbi:MAG: ABC transporter ATP-binding protein [Candidatus Rokubacteria bacterium]|nr:ABC transporter ATP-binding protein [Candidatus Rokubacteria bacterium]
MPTASTTNAHLIELGAATKRYREGDRERVVLDGVDLVIDRTEFVAVVGRSGSGKSTLLNLIGAVDLPSSGDVRVAGQSIVRRSEHERALYRRRSVGFVFQFFNLIPTLTVEENLLLPLELNGVARALARRRAQALLDAVGLGDRGQSVPERLSGGEQQRVAIARALAHRPAIVLADEPTGNLDAAAAREVLGLLRRLGAEDGATIVMATHSSEAADAADRVVALRDGRLVAASPAA